MQAAGDQARAQHPPMGDPLAGMYTAVRAGHRPGAGDERQPPVRLLATPTASRSSSTPPPARAPARRTRCSSPPPRWRRASAPVLHDQRTGSPTRRRVYKQNGGTARAPPTACLNDNANYPATYDMARALTASANTYFVGPRGRARQRRGPGVDMAKAMGMHFAQPQPDAGRLTIIDENHGLVHPRPERDQPAGPGQRLLHAGRATAPSATPPRWSPSWTATASR